MSRTKIKVAVVFIEILDTMSVFKCMICKIHYSPHWICVMRLILVNMKLYVFIVVKLNFNPGFEPSKHTVVAILCD